MFQPGIVIIRIDILYTHRRKCVQKYNVEYCRIFRMMFRTISLNTAKALNCHERQNVEYRMMYVLQWRTVCALTRGLFWCLFSELRSNIYIIFFSYTTYRIHKWREKRRSSYIASVSHSLGLRSADRLLMTSQWLENCDAITWKVISNLLDIDFIQGNIHRRSYKNYFIIFTVAISAKL